MRIRRLLNGNPGSHRYLAKGVWELKVDSGPGYRVYYIYGGADIIQLLVGGSKSTQPAAGIAQALGEVARARGMTHVASDAGLGRESLYRSLTEEGNPTFATVLKVMQALGVRLRVEPADAESRQVPLP